MDSQLSVPKQLMARCPACLANFKSFLCDMTCSNKQSEFIVDTSQPTQASQKLVESPVKKESAKIRRQATANDDDDYSNDDKNEHVEGEDQQHDENSKDVKEMKHEGNEEASLSDKEDVTSYTYFITTTYVNQMFDSCKCVFIL
jgi:hypothetical protein